jgi:glycosyltransferase involved in cell wall biosynthesis
MSSSALVSVLIRSMDRPTLARALDAVAAQTYPNVEAVVVAACGPGHRPLAASIGQVPVRLIVPETRLQRSHAANACMENSRGDWLVFLDDDDAMAPTHVQTLVDAVSVPPGVRVAHTRATLFDAEGRESGIFGGPRVPWLQYECGFFQPGAALFARSLLDDGVRFDPDFDILEDMDFWIQCARHTGFRFVEAATSYYYAESGTSGAGLGSNADQTRTTAALARLRSKWAEDVAATESSYEYLAHYGRDLLARGQSESALTYLARAVKTRPGQVDALNMYGVALLRTGSAQQAFDVFAEGLRLIPKQPQLLANLDLARSALARS